MCVQSDTLLLGDVFNNFRDKCLKIYGHNSLHILSSPGLKLDLLTDMNMLVMVEKGII